ncbi:MAG TPA: hypothetical protein VGH90_09425 [Chthoniobacteraceae bacterium]
MKEKAPIPAVDSELLNKLFPYANYHAEWHLVTWHPSGLLDDAQADRVVEFLESQEKIGGAHFHRYTDMTGYTRIQIGLDHIVRLARRRKRRYLGAPVKSAFYAARLVSLNIAHMYQELMEGGRIQVCTFAVRAAAASWLGVPIETLSPPKTRQASE